MSEEVKAPVAATAPVVEPTPAPVAAAEPTAAPEVAPEASATKPVETEEPTKEEETVPAEEAKPIYEGTLGYGKIPVVGNFLQKNYHFFFGNDPVPAEKLESAIKGAKKEYAHALAWSNETGEGLLYYVKEAAKKDTPAGVIPLHEVSDVSAKGKNGISFSHNGSQQHLKAATTPERDGWLAALHEKIEQAKSMKDTIVGKDSYKETHEKYSKPALLAAGGAAGVAAAPKKSFEDRKARSKSADKERKDRSQSRGKKLFGLGSKKEEVPKTEEEPKPEGEAVAATETAAPEAEAAKPESEAVLAGAAVEPLAPTEEVPAAVKKDRRGSKFLDYLRNATSPTREKKIDEVGLPASEGAVAASAPVIPDTIKTEGETAPVEPVAAPIPEAAGTEAPKAVEETPAEATKPSVKESRRSSFFSLGAKKGKVAPAEEAVKPSADESAIEETSKPAEEATTEAAATPEAGAATTPPAKKENPLVNLARRASTAIRGNKEGKKPKGTAAAATKETEEAEAAKPAEDIPAATSAEPEKAAEEAPTEISAPSEPSAIASANPTVAATA